MQLSIFDAISNGASPSFDPRPEQATRFALADDAWVDYEPAWLSGHLQLMEILLARVQWISERRMMYERMVDVPRLLGRVPEDCEASGLLRDIADTLSARCGLALREISLALYRDGRDSVAPHGDRVGGGVRNSIVATVSLGAPRRFTLRQIAGQGALNLSLGWGDLVVMGGSCQRTWLHGVPKSKHAEPRISIMFRDQSAAHHVAHKGAEVTRQLKVPDTITMSAFNTRAL